MKRAQPEAAIQKSVVKHLRERGVPGLVFFAVPNSSKLGGKRTADGVPLEAIRGKKLGVRSGVSDLILVHARNIYCLELKSPGGRPTESQLAFMSDMEKQGAFTCVAEGEKEAIRTLEAWQLVRGVAQ